MIQENTPQWWFFLSIFVAIGLVCAIMFVRSWYLQWFKPQRVSHAVTRWQTTPLPPLPLAITQQTTQPREEEAQEQQQPRWIGEFDEIMQEAFEAMHGKEQEQ